MLFISHSTKDKEAAIALQDKLLARGYAATQLFLDSDADSGIQAGDRWEEALYSHLKNCEALLVLCSANLGASKWCFAEIVYAKANGKALFPVFIEDCTIEGLVTDHQAVFVWKEGDVAYDRLFTSLDERHLGPTDRFPWPPAGGDSCPYPGLLAFDEKFAGVYFGRESESLILQEELAKMRANGEPRLLMITGGSGSGKSSLLRAGLLPRMSHRTLDGDWIVLPVLRYGEIANAQNSIFDQLAADLATAFPAASPRHGDWKPIRDTLMKQPIDQAAAGFVDLLRDLAIARQRPDATVLLPIDQFEELLAPSAGPVAARFLAFFQALFTCRNGRLLGIGTMRSDYLDLYEHHPAAFAAPYFQPWRLGLLPKERIADVILKPARRVEVDVTDELLAKLLQDTPTTEALPLLAFTLEKLYRKAAGDGKLELHEYTDLGGMDGSIQNCIGRIVPPGSLSMQQQAALRLSFVKHLVQLNDKSEEVRLTAHWDRLPEAARPILEKFVQERLLTRSESCDAGQRAVRVEVAHEALFRCWDDLRRWLRTSADILRWRRDVRRDRANDARWTGLRSAQLAIARDWPEKRWEELEEDEMKWIKDGIRRQRQKLGAAIVVFLAFAIVTAFALVKGHQASLAKNETSRQLSKVSWQLAQQARGSSFAGSDVSPTKATWQLLQAAKASQDAGETAQRDDAIMAANFVSRKLVATMLHAGPVTKAVYSWDGKRVLSWGEEDGTVRLWDAADGKPVSEPMRHERDKKIAGAVYSPDGKRVLSWGDDGMVRQWEAADGKPVGEPMRHNDGTMVIGAVYNWNGNQVLSWGGDGTARLWRAGSGIPVGEPMRHDDGTRVARATYSWDGKRVLSWGGDGTARQWDAADGKPVCEPMRHEKDTKVTGATYSLDGKRVLSWGDDGMVRLWDAEGGKSVGKPMQYTRDVKIAGAVFSPDGSRVLSCGWDGTAQLWDAVDGKPVAEHMRHEKDPKIAGVVFSPDGKRVLSWGDGGTLQLWNAADGKPASAPIWHERNTKVTGAVFNKDGSRMLSWGEDGTARLWEAADGKPVAAPMRHEKHTKVIGAVFTKDESRVLSWGDDGTARLWDTTDGRSVGEPMWHEKSRSGVIAAVCNPDGSQVLSWGDDGTARLWDAADKKPMQHEKETTVVGVAFNKGGSRVLSWGEDGTVRLWNASDGKPVGEPMRHDNGTMVIGAVYSLDGKQVLSWGWDGTVRLWDASDGKPVGESMRHDNGTMVIGAVYSLDGKRVLSWGDDGTVRLWNAMDGKSVGEFMQHEKDTKVVGAVYSLDGKRVLSWGWDGTVRLWDASDGKPVGETMWHEKGTRVAGAVFSPDGRRVLSWGGDGTVRLWKTVDGKPVGQLMQHGKSIFGVVGAVYSWDGKRVLSWGWDGAVRLWDESDGKPVGETMWHEEGTRVTGSAFSPDGNRVLSWGDDGTARLWEAVNGKPVGKRMGHEKGTSVTGAVYSPDGERILSWGDDGTARLWEAAGGEPVGEPMRHGKGILGVTGAMFSKDGSHVISCGYDGTARLWGSAGTSLIAIFNNSGLRFKAIFHPEYQNIITADNDGGLHFIDIFSKSKIELKKCVLEFEVRSASNLGVDGSVRVLTLEEQAAKRMQLQAILH